MGCPDSAPRTITHGMGHSTQEDAVAQQTSLDTFQQMRSDACAVAMANDAGRDTLIRYGLWGT